MHTNKFDGTNVAILQTAAFMAQKFEQAKSLPPEVLCLTTVLSRDQFAALEKNQNGGGGFGLGSVPVLNDDVMTIRFQLGAAQFYWLADMSDPQTWKAVDYWQTLGCVPMGFASFEGKRHKYMFLQAPWPVENAIVNRFRGRQTEAARAEIWEDISSLAKSGLMERSATTDIPGIALKKVVVNVLMTKRLGNHATQTVMSGLRIPGAVLMTM
jgi:hypothetical protein